MSTSKAAPSRAEAAPAAPLVLAVFLVAFTLPLHRWVERRPHAWVALLASTLVVLLAAAVLAGAVALSVAQVTARGPELVRRAADLSQQLGALTWALTTFLLNYVQTIGPFLSVIPPMLYARWIAGMPGDVE